MTAAERKAATAEHTIGRPQIVGGTSVSNPPPIPVTVQPTQLRRPWRTTVRTVFQLATALVTLLPFVVTGVYGSDGDVPAIVAQVLVVDAAIARVMALPQVEAFLRRFAPWLSAAPKA